MKRIAYALITTLTLIIGSVSLSMMKAIEQSDNKAGAPVAALILLLMYAGYIIATFKRYKNAGINPWWSLTGFIPLVTIGTWLVGLFAAPKDISAK